MNRDAIIALLSDIEQSGHERLTALKAREEYQRANPNVHVNYGRQLPERTRGELSNRFARLRGEVIPQYLNLLQTRSGVTGDDLDTISEAIAMLLYRFALESSPANQGAQTDPDIAKILRFRPSIRLGDRTVDSEELCRMALEFAKIPTTITRIRGLLEEINRARQQEEEIGRLSRLFSDEGTSNEVSLDQYQIPAPSNRLPRRISVALLALGVSYSLFTWVPIWQAERAGEAYVEVEQIARHQRTVLKVSDQQWRYLDQLGVLINEHGFTPVTEQGVRAVLQWTKTSQRDWKTLRLKSEGKIGLAWFLLCPVVLLLWFR
jgi:hypothetical protein